MKKKKIIITIITLIVIIAIIVVAIYITNKNAPKPEEALSAYIELLNEQKYDEMYNMISESSKSQISQEDLKRVSILYKDIENTFQGFFGTKVKLNPGKKKGKIVIEYASNEDLERILKLMK